jgi:hypothetical protein
MYKFLRTVSLPALTLGLAWATQTIAAHAAGRLDIVPASRFIAGSKILRPAPCVPMGTQCAFRPFNTSRDLAFASAPAAAQPAVAKDTIPPGGPASFIHQARFANDGNYGNGASWISDSPDSWLKIDLGRVQPINRFLIGRDRLGFFNDRDPGNFIIEVANEDNMYVNGDDSDDELEYSRVFDSAEVGFSGQINGSDTLRISIPAVNARFVKLTFANAGTAIDEVEVRLAP